MLSQALLLTGNKLLIEPVADNEVSMKTFENALLQILEFIVSVFSDVLEKFIHVCLTFIHLGAIELRS